MSKYQLTDMEKTILNVCNNGYIVLSAIVEKTKLSKDDCVTSVNWLWKQGLLEQEYGQQYATTQKGSDALINQNDSVTSRADSLIEHYSLFINSAVYDDALDTLYSEESIKDPFGLMNELNQKVKETIRAFLKEKFGE